MGGGVGLACGRWCGVWGYGVWEVVWCLRLWGLGGGVKSGADGM